MKAREGKIRKWLGVTVAILCIASCSNRSLMNIPQTYPSVISEDDTVAATPGPYANLTPAILLADAPSSVVIQPVVGNNPSGQGYIFQMTWTFTGISPAFWEVNFYSDDNAGSAPTIYQGGTTIQNGASLQFQSATLTGNRMYQFQLVANINDPSKNIGGEVIYKTVTVNLKGIGGP